jgi:hypothetical protein
MSKNYHRDMMLMVWNSVENLASQMAGLTVRASSHRSTMFVPKPKAHSTQSVVRG